METIYNEINNPFVSAFPLKTIMAPYNFLFKANALNLSVEFDGRGTPSVEDLKSIVLAKSLNVIVFMVSFFAFAKFVRVVYCIALSTNW